MRESVLDQIPGVGPARKKALLKQFRTVAAIGKADLTALEQVLPRGPAQAVYDYFHQQEGEAPCESLQDQPGASG